MKKLLNGPLSNSEATVVLSSWMDLNDILHLQKKRQEKQPESSFCGKTVHGSAEDELLCMIAIIFDELHYKLQNYSQKVAWYLYKGTVQNH